MKRTLAAFAFLLLAACSTSKPHATEAVDVDPVTEPTIAGAVDEAVMEASIEAEEGAIQGRRIGRVVGVLAAVFGGPQSESLDDMVDRYRRTRDAITVTGALIGAAKGATAGAERGYEFDLQFAELVEIEGLQVTRPFPDEIYVRFDGVPTPDTLAQIAVVFSGREARAIAIEGPADAALALRESLLDLGVEAARLDAHRDDALQAVAFRVRYAY